MGNDGIHLIAVADGGTQFCVLSLNEPLGSHQLNLVHYTHDKLLLVERFGQEVTGAYLEAMHQVARIVQGGQEDDGNVLRLRILLQDACCLESVDARHHHVEQNQIRMLGLGLLNTSLATIGRTHLELLVAEQDFQQENVTDNVIDNQDLIVAFVNVRLKLFKCFHVRTAFRLAKIMQIFGFAKLLEKKMPQGGKNDEKNAYLCTL